MIGSLMRKIFGSANDRYVKSLQKTVAKINALEPEISALSDDELKNKRKESNIYEYNLCYIEY